MFYKLIGILGYLVYFLGFPLILQAIWPTNIVNRKAFFIVVIVISQNLIQILVCAYYEIIYQLKHPFFEQFKLVDKPWPWEKNKEEWKKLKIKTIKTIILNQSIAAFLVSFIPPFECRMDVDSFPSYIEIMKHVIICHLSEDFIFYWSHRILHLPQFYPYVHKIHHQYNVSIAISTEYAHPIEFISSNIIPIFSGPYLLGSNIHLITIIVYVGLHLSKAIHQHCGYVFPWELYNYLPFATNSIHHGLHHSENTGNYGSQFIFFDKLFGTCIKYKRDWNIVDDELNRKLKQLQELKSQLDDQSAEQLLLNKDLNQEYNSDVNYYKEFWRFYILNEMTIKKVNDLHSQNQKLHELISDIDKLLSELHIALSYRHKKKNRRTSNEIDKNFVCPYNKCNKQYGSDVSLNLHIKLKHDGGNKTDREKFAKMIIEAQQNGDSVTDLNINIEFPPGYLEQFKSQFLNNQQTQLNQERKSIEQD